MRFSERKLREAEFAEANEHYSNISPKGLNSQEKVKRQQTLMRPLKGI